MNLLKGSGEAGREKWCCMVVPQDLQVQVGNNETFLLRKSGQALEMDAHGGGGITVPDDVQGKVGHGA